MKLIIKGLFITILLLGISVKAQIVEAPIPKVKSVDEIITEEAKKYQVSESLMRSIIQCESNGSTTIQSNFYRNGIREESWGIAQWNIPAKNTKLDGSIMTKDDALDPEIAISTMAWYLSQGKANLWTCYKGK